MEYAVHTSRFFDNENAYLNKEMERNSYAIFHNVIPCLVLFACLL